MEEKETLSDIFKDLDEKIKILITPVIDEIIFLQDKLSYLRTLPFLRVSEKNASIQKATPAAKQYKEFLQQYTNCIRILASFVSHEEGKEDDQFLEAVNMIKERYGKV